MKIVVGAIVGVTAALAFTVGTATGGRAPAKSPRVDGHLEALRRTRSIETYRRRQSAQVGVAAIHRQTPRPEVE